MSQVSINENKNDMVDARPVKSFFVSMLTRDIELSDAILDLLDNCIDGVLRKTGTLGKQPFKDYYAKITFSESSFLLKDNCGGIPLSLKDYAFRMGRPAGRLDRRMGTVGTYGIGMKRAIFKIGRDCIIKTKSANDSYKVSISEKWLSDESQWTIPLKMGEGLDQEGTEIFVKKLYKGVSSQFGHEKASFLAEFIRKIATHYAFIINKGFKIYVNDQIVEGRPTQLIFDDKHLKRGIQPYIYKTEVDGVQVFLSIGFSRPILSIDEANDEIDEKRHSSLDAGWTVICNDRAVLYCDKTELTGWGVGSVPRYHTQFIAISGIVEFRSDDPSKLPTTTTKRGIDASSTLYLQVKDKMQEGMSLFIRYTNKWKTDIELSKKHMSTGHVITFDDLKKKSTSLSFSEVRKGAGGQQFRPNLPLPALKESSRKRITYIKDVKDIKMVSSFLFGESEIDACEVGEQCFDEILREAKK